MDNILNKLHQVQGQPAQPQVPQQSSTPNISGFQQYILKKYPNLDKGNQTALQDFVNKQNQAQLVEKGAMPFPDLVKSSPGTALSLVNKGFKIPEPAKTNEQVKKENALNDLKSATAQIQIAKDALNKSGSGIQYTGYPLRENLPGPLGINSSAKDTNAALSAVNTQLFKIAGTQFPKNEQALLGGIVLGLSKSKEGNQQALIKAQERINNQMANFVNVDPVGVNKLRKAGYSEDEIYDYLTNQ